MEYRALGATGITVSVYCLGAMMFGSLGNPDPDECASMVGTALDAGVNFVDTADMYSRGESERIVGAALRGRRDRVVVSTKCFWPMHDDDPNQRGLSRRWIVAAAEASLRRLGTDWIDVYFLHKPDARTGLDESLGALSDLVRAGKVRAGGISTYPATQIVEAQRIAQQCGYERPWVEQPPYSLFVRGIERDVLPTCARHRMGVMVWSPLNAGWLAGNFRPGAAPDPAGRVGRRPASPAYDSRRPPVQAKHELFASLELLAREAEMTLPALALRFAIEHPVVTSAIVGPRTPRQLREILATVGPPLDEVLLDRIDAIVAPGHDVDPLDRFEHAPAARDARLRRR